MVIAAVLVLNFGAHEAFHHRVHRLEVRGVGGQLQIHLLAAAGLHFRRVAHVVLYVAVAHGQVGHGRALKLRENLLVRLAHDVGQHVEPAAMGHANHHFLHAQLGPFANDGIERRNRRFAAFEREALLPQKLGVQEVLEYHGLVQLLQNALLVLRAGIKGQRVALHLGPEPVEHLRVADVHVLEADGPGVYFLQRRHNVAQRGLAAEAQHLAVLKHGIQIGFTQAKIGEVEAGLAVFALAHRVGFGAQVAPAAESVDEVAHGRFLIGRNFAAA